MSHLTHLRTFVAAYRLKSITKAADMLGRTQPAASMHIQSLEALVGKPLFVRSARGITATEAAHALARSAGPLLDGLEATLASYQSGAEKGGTIHIAGPADFLYAKIAPGLAPLLEEGYLIRLHTGNRERIDTLLGENAVDFAITASMPDEQAHDYGHLCTERLLLVMAPELAAKLGKKPTAQALASAPLIAFDEDLPLVRPVWAALFQRAPALQAALTVPDLRLIEDLVCRGDGWSVLPDTQCAAALKSGRLVALTLKQHAPANDLYLVWNRNSVRSARHVHVHVRDFILGML